MFIHNNILNIERIQNCWFNIHIGRIDEYWNSTRGKSTIQGTVPFLQYCPKLDNDCNSKGSCYLGNYGNSSENNFIKSKMRITFWPQELAVTTRKQSSENVFSLLRQMPQSGQNHSFFSSPFKTVFSEECHHFMVATLTSLSND